jgi:two-component system response regulator HydG
MAETAAAQVLIVEDEPDHAEVMAEALRKPGHVCTIVHSVARALDELKHGSFDVIVTDLRMPESGGMDGVSPDGADAGLKVLEAARRLMPHAEVVMVTAHGDVATARAAFKLGAYDFIEKPLDLAVFRELVNRAAATVLMRSPHEPQGTAAGSAHADAAAETSTHPGFDGLIAGSEPMRRVIRAVRAVAASNLPVLITGESGTGKELIAAAVHANSSRSKGRFVALNCAAETETLLEDQLFGHVRGAFTGAEKDREGVFEYASGGSGGTLFLDEIGDMPLKMQAKLLRVLETGTVVRLGSNEPRKTDVRLVSATNKDLGQMIAKGEFREDLYFRIKGAQVHLPPLRERREDIPRITRAALARAWAMVGKPIGETPGITDAAMMRLTSYHWPGNVRQLLNVVQHMVVTALPDFDPGKPGMLDTRHIPDEVRAADDGPESDDAIASGASVGVASSSHISGAAAGTLAGTSLEQIEKRAIRETLGLTQGNREQAAKLLGIGERTLYRKLKEYGLR